MSLHARCQQRIASTSAHRTVWRRRCVRHYAADTAGDPEWFQKVRDDFLSRRPRYHPEELDVTHYDYFHTTLNGFEPSAYVRRGTSKVHVPLAELLTRFNVRVKAAELLDDGTDPFHFPGKPWVHRLWAGGAVRVRPGRALGARAGSVTPFRLRDKVACLERIQDVRLQGTGDEAKIHVTIERSFALSPHSAVDAGSALSADDSKRVRVDPDWSNAPVIETRTLVFKRTKTSAELAFDTTGQELRATRYLKAPQTPDYAHSLTPTRSLLFRYSAITYNAHLLHLDPTYARDVEGHRNVLVHGPLTLTLMLQVLNRHLKPMLEAVTSINYRNLASLYCDEEMRICVKKRTQTDTGHLWDVWIEGPTGGMAVKATARSTLQSLGPLEKPNPKPVEGAAGADLPDVQTVATQAQDTLHSLNREPAGTAQLSQVTREERRRRIREDAGDSPESSQSVDPDIVTREVSQLTREVPGSSPESSQPAAPITHQEFTQFSRQWRKQWIGRTPRYLYFDPKSPLFSPAVVDRKPASSAPISYPKRKQWVGKSLAYLYLRALSPLLNNNEVDRHPPPTQNAPEPGSTQHTGKPSLPADEGSVFEFLSTGSAQDERESSTSAAERKTAQKEQKLTVRKVEGFRIREIGSSLREDGVGFRKAGRRRAQEKAVSEGVRKREEREGRADTDRSRADQDGAGNDMLDVLRAAQEKRGAGP